MLSDDQVRSLADGEGRVYHFDLSKIPNEFYEPLLRTLQHFAQKNIESLGFSCDDLLRAEQQSLSGKPMPVSVLNSIIKTKSRAVHNVVELIAYILPRSTRLLELVLSRLDLDRNYRSRVITALSRSVSLEAIYFSRIQLGADGLRALLSTVDPNQIRSITLSSCGITSECTPDILNFIRMKNVQLAKNGGIQVFEVSRPQLPVGDSRSIAEALGREIPSVGREMPSVGREIPSLAREMPSPIRSTKTQVKKRQFEQQAEREIAELQELEAENAALKAELSRLRKSIDAVEFKEDVYIVGKGAEAFVAFVAEIEAKLDQLEGGPKRRP
jgi:hypothetical protein